MQSSNRFSISAHRGETLPRVGAHAGAELAIKRTDARRLYLTVGSADIEAPIDCFRTSSTAALLPGGWELGITISLPTDVDILRITESLPQCRASTNCAWRSMNFRHGARSDLNHCCPIFSAARTLTNRLESMRQPLRRLESHWLPARAAIKPVLPCTSETHSSALQNRVRLVLTTSSRTLALCRRTVTA